MYEFFDRLVSFALPAVPRLQGRFAKGVLTARGNYTLGIREGNIFPEASFETRGGEVLRARMNITITTTAAYRRAKARALLRHLGMPFRSIAKKWRRLSTCFPQPPSFAGSAQESLQAVRPFASLLSQNSNCVVICFRFASPCAAMFRCCQVELVGAHDRSHC